MPPNRNDKYEGVTNLVEHPIQMKAPGELLHSVVICVILLGVFRIC